jgi:hypothetical protein
MTDETQKAEGYPSISAKDIDLMMETFAKAHPEFEGTEQPTALRKALGEIESKSVAIGSTRRSASQTLTTIATALGGSAALGLVAAAAIPDLPAIAIVAAVSGFIVSKLASRQVDKVSRHNQKE